MLIHALAAGRNFELLAKQIHEFTPKVVVVSDVDSLASYLKECGIAAPELSRDLVGIAVAPEVDIVMSSIVGVAGLPATYAAIRAGKRIGLANKEVLNLPVSSRNVLDLITLTPGVVTQVNAFGATGLQIGVVKKLDVRAGHRVNDPVRVDRPDVREGAARFHAAARRLVQGSGQQHDHLQDRDQRAPGFSLF